MNAPRTVKTRAEAWAEVEALAMAHGFVVARFTPHEGGFVVDFANGRDVGLVVDELEDGVAVRHEKNGWLPEGL